jgi:two-component system sensor histidine kinase KdpD
LLEITRLEAGVQLNREWQLLEEVIGAALNRLESRLRNYPVNIDLPEDLPLLLMDSVLITQVFINLLDNARKFSPPGHPIDISARLAEGSALVEVADRGAGLPPGDETRIFQKFYGAQRSASSMSVGLGLAICQGIIQAHGGRIWAKNRPGGGAIFCFTLPATEPPPVIEPAVAYDEDPKGF